VKVVLNVGDLFLQSLEVLAPHCGADGAIERRARRGAGPDRIGINQHSGNISERDRCR
jgi:hypothetical protein